MLFLLVTSGAFLLIHIVLSSRLCRPVLVGRMGEWPFRGLYSVLSIITFSAMIFAYIEAPTIAIWEPHMAMRHSMVSVVMVSCLLIACGYSTPNPTAIGQSSSDIINRGAKGVFRITRHPILWAWGLWALSHFAASSHGAEMILFGTFTLLSFGGAWHLDCRMQAKHGEAWATYCQGASFIPFAAILAKRQSFVWAEIGLKRVLLGITLYAILFLSHEWVTGWVPLPMPVS